MGLAFLFNAVLKKFQESRYRQVAFGLLFGGIVVLGMTNPLSLGEGLIFDTRTLLVGAATVFVGPLAGAIALFAGIICRVVIGGAGTTAGLVGLLLAYGLALAWDSFVHHRIKSLVLRDALMGFVVTFSAAAFFVLPYELALTLLASVLPTLLLVNIGGMVVIGLVFRREIDQFENRKMLEAYAKTDSLTNLLNRRGMDAEIATTQFDPDIGHALFYFDIDDFKSVNDTYGHAAGDAALAIVAARIKDGLRNEAVFARHGGDEFSIYLPHISAADVRAVGQRLCASISEQAFTCNDLTFDVSISIGAFWSQEDIPIRLMIERADAQLMLAKQAGKNRAQVAYDRQGQSTAVA
jgi:diguanylate cyclase